MTPAVQVVGGVPPGETGSENRGLSSSYLSLANPGPGPPSNRARCRAGPLICGQCCHFNQVQCMTRTFQKATLGMLHILELTYPPGRSCAWPGRRARGAAVTGKSLLTLTRSSRAVRASPPAPAGGPAGTGGPRPGPSVGPPPGAALPRRHTPGGCRHESDFGISEQPAARSR